MRDLDLTTLRLFVAVCETRSIARAGEQASIVGSAISKRLAQLEETVGTPLLLRKRRGESGAPPTFNFRSDNRSFKDSRRCLIICSGFFEFTGSKYPKAKHRFSLRDSPIMGIAGLWSEAEDGSLSFTMLTTSPGPDIEPYHDRQICVLQPADWAAWLFLSKPEAELLKPLPAGSLRVETVRPEKA